MILLAAVLLAGDAWTYDVTLRYDDAEGLLLLDRERWTVRVGKGRTLEAERAFVGTQVDENTLVRSDAKPETAEGGIATDGTLILKTDWTDPAATKTIRRLLTPIAKDERLTDWPQIVRHLIRREPQVKMPGSGLPASLTVEATLVSARLGGKDIDLPKP